MDHEEHRRLYLHGIATFNAGEFYDSHDIWEELWADYRGRSRKFYQGLIQTAVALYHLDCGNLHGARRMYFSSRSYLEPFRPRHLGLDLDQLFAAVQAYMGEWIESPDGGLLPKPDPALAPKMHLGQDLPSFTPTDPL